MGKVKCKGCGKETNITSACCWITCENCGEQICRECGSTDLEDVQEDGCEAEYWCCLRCGDCGEEGCRQCV